MSISFGRWNGNGHPIAVRLVNGCVWRNGSFEATLSEVNQRERWHCLHQHESRDEAEACARRAWFEHHG